MTTDSQFVAYYWVSTEKQGRSGLGLEAQREAVIKFMGKPPVSEYTEIESGRRDENRPQLIAAMDECKRRRHRLVTAKLDRLTRDPDFIGKLYKSGVDFVATDNPYANKLTIRILAAVAEHEREMISALLEKKRLGRPVAR
jgi:DNA invertase Pin-like site-specific DNA recombinase